MASFRLNSMDSGKESVQKAEHFSTYKLKNVLIDQLIRIEGEVCPRDKSKSCLREMPAKAEITQKKIAEEANKFLADLTRMFYCLRPYP